MTPESVSRSFMIVFAAMVVGVPISTNAETVKANAETSRAMDAASTDGSFIVAQTNGQDRRGSRQDCRQQEGAVGADKRNCKQQAR